MPKLDLFSKDFFILFILVGYVLFLRFYENYLGFFLFFIIGAILYGCMFRKNKLLVLCIAILFSFGLSAVNNGCLEEGFEEEEEEEEDKEEKPIVIDTNKPMDQLSDKEIAKIQAEVNSS